MSVKIASLYAEITADTSKFQSGLKQSKAGLADMKTAMGAVGLAAGIMTGAFLTAQKAISATVGEYVKYANQVRTITQITGQSAEAVSRMIQLSDDYKISTEQLTLAMKKLAGEGAALTTESLAKLSDAYLKLAPGVERQTFLTEKFGKQGQAFAEIMLAGGDAIREQSAAIDESLILTDAAVKRARDYEKALDDMNDSAYAVKISMGQYILPALNDFLIYVNKSITGWQEFLRWLKLTSKETDSLVVLQDRIDKVRAEMEDAAAAGDLGALTYANLEVELSQLYDQYNIVSAASSGFGDILEEETEAARDYAEYIGAAAGSLLDLSVASYQASLGVDGVISADDAQKINDFALSIGAVTAEEYAAAQAAIALQVALDNLPDNVDIAVRVAVYNAAVAGSTYDPYGAVSGGEVNPGATPKKAAGGYVSSRYAIVGDSPNGPTGHEEVVDFQNKRVYSNAQSRAMGALPSYAGGSGGEMELSQMTINKLADALSLKLAPFL